VLLTGDKAAALVNRVKHDSARKDGRMGFSRAPGERAAAIFDWIRRRPLQAVALAGLFCLLQLGMLALGVLAQREDIPARVKHRIEALFQARAGDVQVVEWRETDSNLHTLQWAKISIGPERRGGGLAEVDGNIVFASAQGHFGYLDRHSRLAPIDLHAPLNLEALRASPLMRDPLFELVNVRVQDLFSRNIAPHRWELYATYSPFVRENCFEFVLARVVLDTGEGGVRPENPDWHELYIARPGCIPYKDHSWRFVGEQAGGRIQMLNDHTLLVSIGDHQFDGYNDRRNAPMDPSWDLGKIITYDLNNGHVRQYAIGLRNPQGLLIARDGRIFETEHGPHGGDELNLIEEGRNYGWPIVTYGMNYGFPRRDWEADPTPGGHDIYTRPLLAFVPSVGVSNLAQADTREFPLWGDNDLLVQSLRAETLFHIRLDGDRVAYSEPLPFEGERLRDIISLSDGRLAMLTDSGDIILVRNAERHLGEPPQFSVAGVSSLTQDELSAPNATPAERGRQMFAIGCGSCHSVTGEAGAGPPLNGVVGRRVGSVAGFPYSEALVRHGGVWTEEAMTRFITDPQHAIPGTTMPAPSLSWTQAPNIIAYLRTTRAGDR
jgi:cytochrome c2